MTSTRPRRDDVQLAALRVGDTEGVRDVIDTADDVAPISDSDLHHPRSSPSRRHPVSLHSRHDGPLSLRCDVLEARMAAGLCTGIRVVDTAAHLDDQDAVWDATDVEQRCTQPRLQRAGPQVAVARAVSSNTVQRRVEDSDQRRLQTQRVSLRQTPLDDPLLVVRREVGPTAVLVDTSSRPLTDVEGVAPWGDEAIDVEAQLGSDIRTEQGGDH